MANHNLDRIVVEHFDSTAIVRFNRPHERNPLTVETLAALEVAIDNITNNSRTRAIIFTGAADVFLSGANIRELAQLDAPMAVDFSHRGQAIMQSIAGSKLMTIAAINGYCMGGGLDLALACDIRIANAAAVFAHPGARLGIITGWGGTQRLPRLIGKSQALDLFTTARRLESTEALRIGLITGIFEDVVEQAKTLAKQYSRRDSL
jgi:enoyl-CoA hydratase